MNEAEEVTPGRRKGDFIVLNRVVSLREVAGKAAI